MNRIRPFLAGAALLLAFAASRPVGAADEPEPFKRLSIHQVEKLLGQPKVHIYDGNSAETYARNHVPGAVNLHSSDIKEGVLPADKGATLVFYCQNTL
ncbi:MAG TPA: rhodanese-like domain-containing protein [Dongiaceae bacterium]|nr:rhodanese-like domain-containing protein [Dongiaceae bacterium]